MMRGPVLWTSIAALALGGATLPACGLHGKPEVQRRAPPAAGAAPAAPAHAGPSAPASPEPAPDVVVAPGIVEPWGGQAELSAREPGWIATVAVAEGDVVQAGQLLATLDDEGQRHALGVARAELAEAEATLARVEHGATPEELRQAEADRAVAAARSELARTEAARTTALHDQRVIPDAEADRASVESRVQAALAERAGARLVEVQRGVRAEDRSAVRARVQAARARVQLAEASLARRRVVAPAAGKILLSRYHPGEFHAVGGAPLFVLGDTSRLQVRLEVDEIDALALAPGASCALYSDAGARLADGVVLRLAPKMGRRALAIETPTARADVRVREAFVALAPAPALIPGLRVWAHATRERP